MIKIINASTISKFGIWNAKFYGNNIFDDTINYASLEKDSLAALNSLPEYLHSLLLKNIVLSVSKGYAYKTYSTINNTVVEDIIPTSTLKLYKETIINKQFPIKAKSQVKNQIAALVLWSISTINNDVSIKDSAKRELIELQQKLNQLTTYLEGMS